MDYSAIINFWSSLDLLIRSASPRYYFISRSIELVLVAAAFMFVMLVFMKWFGFCSRLRSTRREMQQHLYGVILHHRSPRMVFWSEMMMVWSNLKLMVWLLPTVLFGAMLFAAIYGVMVDRYGTEPLAVNRPVLVRNRALASANGQMPAGELKPAGDQVTIEGMTRVPAIRTVWARLRASEPGIYSIQSGGDRHISAAINIATPGRPAWPLYLANGFEITVDYPSGRWWGLQHGWLVFFLLACLVTGIPLGRLLRLRI